MTAFPVVQAEAGITRQVLADHPDLMTVAVTFETGAVGAAHRHPHVQAVYVQSGRFRFTVDGTETDIGPGDSLVVPSDALHGCVCLEAGNLVDCFTPRRDDFL